MSSNSPPSIFNHNRLYTRFITTLKVIQYIGYFVVAISNIVPWLGLSKILSGFNFFSGFFNATGLESLYPIVINSMILTSVISTLVDFIIVYIITQSLIAIIDLLSRIERNTRIEK